MADRQRIRSVRGGPAPQHRLALNALNTYGSGPPVTVFAHGLGATVAETRIFGSGVRGTKVFPRFSGTSYPAAAVELRAACDLVGADGCVGVSLGAGALELVLAETPDRFAYAVFVLPAMAEARAALGWVTARCLVVAQEGDDVHPVGVAYDLAAALPDATLHVFDHPLIEDRPRLRALVSSWVHV